MILYVYLILMHRHERKYNVMKNNYFKIIFIILLNYLKMLILIL